MAGRITNRNNTSCASPSRLSNGSPSSTNSNRQGRTSQVSPQHDVHARALHAQTARLQQSGTGTFWNYHLYLVQENAPKPILVQYEADYVTRMTEEVNYEEAPYSQYQKMTQKARQRFSNKGKVGDRHPSGEVSNKKGTGHRGQKAQPPSPTPPTMTASTSQCNQSNANTNTISSDTTNEHDTSGETVDHDQDSLVTPEDSISQGRPNSQCIGTAPENGSVQFESKGFDLSQPHRFKVHTFRANFCDFCGNFMWGLVQQGVKCEDCGFAAHKKCSHKAYEDCTPSMKYVKRMFSVDLTTLCMAHGVTVPPLVNDCIGEVDSRGLFAEGIYRVPGSHDEIDRLRITYDVMGATANRPGLLAPNKVEDINSIAGLLKLYLRLLPQPLLTPSVYRNMVNSLSTPMSDVERVKTISEFAKTLPQAHFETLKVLMLHLQRVARHSAANRMTADNLVMVFAPTLLVQTVDQCVGGQNQNEQSKMGVRHGEHKLLHFLITNADKVFL